MAHQRAIVRAGTTFAIATLIAACGGASAPSSVPAAPPTSSPSTTASPTASVTEAPSAAPASVAPSPKARPSLDIDLAELDAYLTSSITLLDLADDDLAVTVTYVDPGSEESASLGTYTLASMDQMTNSVPPGTYRLDFRQPPDSTTGPSCTIEIADADGYVFAAVDDAVAISRTGTAPTDARELFVATSSLCQQ
ncbi:MAG: hypothetical protein Q7S35_10135 [Candidatus Limnocylindrales bacterium]|nr:hypothetical protein [Candidatus Limnocylindrales bacterium]